MSLKLDRIVDITVSSAKIGVTTATFNEGLIIGTSSVITTTERVREYTSLDDMLTDGFTSSSPEYKAATLYFDADSAPDTLWVGRQTATSISAISVNAAGTDYNVNDVLTIVQSGGSGGTATVTAIENGGISTATINAAGTGYSVDDVLTIVQSGGSGGTAKVATIGTSGEVTSIVVTAAGTSYNVGTNLTTTVSPSGGSGCTLNITAIIDGGVSTVTLTTDGTGYATGTGLTTTVSPSGGSGCTIDITSISGETAVEAVTACRAAGLSWYSCYVCDAQKADHIAIAAYIESLTPASTYFYDTSDSDIPTGTSGNIFATLKSNSYTRCLGIYCTTTDYAGAAVMGEAMGLNTGLANSAFTLKFKTLTGVTVESLTTSQVNIIENNNGNVYINYASEYDIFEQGKMSYGYFFDQVIYRDMLVNYIQIEIMNLLTSNNKIPLTDAGISSLVHVINQQCSALQTIGYIAPSGTWSGTTVLNISNGDTLSNGYSVQTKKVSTLTSTQRQNRIAPPIYVCLIEAGAVHSMSIGVYIQA